MSELIARLPAYLTGHLQVTLAALAIATIVSVPLGIVAARVPWLERPVLAVAGVVQTIPALALLAVMVPILSSLDLRSIGFLPALIGLTLYAVLPIVQNTIVGLRTIEPAIREAARGCGMDERQVLRQVELPLALPVIMAGLRTATVWTVGMATLSTPVGFPSLGNFIFAGLQTRNLAAILVGCASAAVLALLLDAIMQALSQGLAARKRGRAIAAAVVLLALAVVSVAAALPRGGRAAGPIRIGAKTFTEQYILGEVLAGQVVRRGGRAATVSASLGSTVAFDALRAGDIDAYVDYSGTLWNAILKRDATGVTRGAMLEALERALADAYGIEVLGALGFENAYALATRRETADRFGLRTITDLGPQAGRMSIGSDYEFFSRPEWTALRNRYGLRFAAERTMDPSLLYQAAGQATVDVISAYSTDGRIDAYHLVVLEDDRGAIPPYDAIVLARAGLARDAPAARDALRNLAGTIDAGRMRQMNRQVDEHEASPRQVAAEFLRRLDAR